MKNENLDFGERRMNIYV